MGPVRVSETRRLPESDRLALPIAEKRPVEAMGPRDIRYVRTLRISVTDHCNFRCVYCMPHEGVEWLARPELLGFEEIAEVATAAISLGVTDFKLTGGEPLLRRNLPTLVAMLRGLPGCGEISLTTNGHLLAEMADDLASAGVNRVTVSLDTLQPQRFRQITRTGEIARVWSGIERAEAAGLGPVKLNVVVMRDFNLDELPALAALSIDQPRTVRFIEFMPLAESQLRGREDQFVSFEEMRVVLERAHGPLEAADLDVGHGPARVFRLRGARGRLGFIHAMSAPFCATCNRLRLTPEGLLRSCLFDGGEVDVRAYLRPAIERAALRNAFTDCLKFKPDVHQPYGNRQMSRIGG